jgi:hypothetical protein
MSDIGMRVIVCGSHHATDRKPVWRSLDQVHASRPIRVLIEGDAPGVDRFAHAWAEEHGICGITIKPHWHRMGKKAGPIRNGWMLTHCWPVDALIAFDGGPGTANMIAQAGAAGVELIDCRTG